MASRFIELFDSDHEFTQEELAEYVLCASDTTPVYYDDRCETVLFSTIIYRGNRTFEIRWAGLINRKPTEDSAGIYYQPVEVAPTWETRVMPTWKRVLETK